MKDKNEFLMKRDNKCQILEQVIKKAIDYLENATIVEDSYYHQRKCLLDILKEVE